MNKKEKLQKQLNDIVEAETKEMIKEHYPTFKKMISKCFKTKNSYGSGKNWWLYAKIISLKSGDLYINHENKVLANCRCLSFQTTVSGETIIKKEIQTYVHLLGEEISAKEFDHAWIDMIDEISGIY